MFSQRGRYADNITEICFLFSEILYTCSATNSSSRSIFIDKDNKYKISYDFICPFFKIGKKNGRNTINKVILSSKWIRF